MPSSAPLILLAAGGTGGHVFPAEALARELLGRGYRVALATDQRGGKFSDDVPVPAYRLNASSLGKGILGRAKSFLAMGMGVLQARSLINKLHPAAVVGFGGYPSIPALYAAARVTIPIVLHEQNAVLGRANRAMMTKAKFIATSFPRVQGFTAATKGRMVQTGNPVRPAFATLRATPYTPVSDDGPLNLLVMGGSLGARVFSQVVPQAIALMPDHLRRRLVIAQQCRTEDMDSAHALYAGCGIEVELAPFFHDVPERLATAQLVICRSGGSTVAELTAIGRPAILVPYPHGHAGEQMANAEAVAEAGGAWIIPEQAFTAEALAVRLESLLTLPGSLAKTAAAARAWGTVSAADHLADCVEQAIGKAQGSNRNFWSQHLSEDQAPESHALPRNGKAA
jgi:UDP-N-acetylglucosamine--N-acetylmuramyl-(pentapeptide) pyrophosphoryl-undecaprenol N-acetylglucosamine transferase